jgi:carbon-monoxide dehydrogenase small subunit
VHVDGRATKSCNVLAAQMQGASVLTIEGLAPDGALHPMQAAFREHHGLQCGFCTPGFVMNAIELARSTRTRRKRRYAASSTAIFAAVPAITIS